MSSVVRMPGRFTKLRMLLTFMLLTGAPAGAYAACPGQVPSADTMGLDCNAQQQREDQRRESERLEQERQQQQQQADQQYYDAMQRDAMQRQQATVEQGQQVRQAWESRPPLPPAQNPLLGRWNSLGAPGSGPPGPNGQDDLASLAAALVGGMVSGLCDSMLGQGVVEFRPTSVVAFGPDGSSRVLYHASYRGGGSRVAVLPLDSPDFTHMIIDFDRPGHGVVAGVGCVVTRVGESGAAAAATAVNKAGRPVSSTARAEPALRYNYDYVCTRGLRIVVGHCRHDGDTPGVAPTSPADDYCQVYYPDRGSEAKEMVLRSQLIESLQACGAFGAATSGANAKQNTAAAPSPSPAQTAPPDRPASRQ